MKNDNSSFLFLVVLFAFMLTFFVSRPACTYSNSELNGVLRNEGLTNAVGHGYSWVGCPESSIYHTSFQATNQRGDVVHGTLCCNLFSCTTVFDAQ
jgi:hypothetical protein